MSGFAGSSASGADSVDLNLEQVDLQALARLVRELTGRRIVVPGTLQARISIQADGLTPEQVMPVFVSALESAGLTLVHSRGTDRVVPLPEGSLGIAPVWPHEDLPVSEKPAEGLLTRVFRLQHADAEAVGKLFESLGSRRGSVGVIEASNLLVITDTATVLHRVSVLLDQIDEPGPERVLDVIELTFADAEQTARLLTEALREARTRAGQLLDRLPMAPEAPPRYEGRLPPPTLVPAPGANRLVLSGTPAQLENLRTLIQRMDAAEPSGRSRLNVIFLRYINAETSANGLNNLLERAAAAGDDRRRRIAVEADTANNALLIDAMPQDFDRVRQLVEQLDVAPEQVHISVLIIEVADSDDLTLGVEMTALSLPDGRGDLALSGGTRFGTPDESQLGILDALQAGLFPRGITVGVGRGQYFDETGNLVVGYPGILNINALRERGKVDILSETSLEAQNNHEASVSVVDEIPVLKSTIIGGSGTARDVIRNIERMEVGVKLRMTPQIIPGGQVRVDLHPSIEAITGDAGADGLTPVIAKRSVSTTVTVPDGETIVIAGLTRRDQQSIRRRVPLLGSVPVLGWLFRHDVDRDTRTNLLIFVTPRIVRNMDDARRISDTWREKTGISMQESVRETQN